MLWHLVRRLTWLYGLIIPCVLIFLFLAVWQKQKTEYQLWREQLEDIEHFPQRYPKQDDSASAQALKKVAQPLGIDLGRSRDNSDLHPSEEQKSRFQSLSGSDSILSKYLKTQIEKSDQSIDEMPHLISSYLQAYEKPLAIIKEHILTSEPVRWKMDFEMHYDKLPNSPLPNLSGLLSLQRLLLSDALRREKGGQTEEAERCIEAVWKLNQILHKRPEGICRRIAQLIDRYEFGALRKFNRLSSVWRARFKDPDYRRQLLSTYATEVFSLVKWANEGDFPKEGHILLRNMRSYQRFCVADYSEKMRLSILKCLRQDLCNLDARTFDDYKSHPFASWNRIGSTAWVNPENMLGLVAKLMIDRELTIKILQIKDGLIRSDTKELPCEMCSNAKWKLETLTNSKLRIRFEGSVVYEKHKDPNLPIEFTLRTAPE